MNKRLCCSNPSFRLTFAATVKLEKTAEFPNSSFETTINELTIPAVARDVASAAMTDLDAQTAADMTGTVKFRGKLAAVNTDTVHEGVWYAMNATLQAPPFQLRTALDLAALRASKLNTTSSLSLVVNRLLYSSRAVMVKSAKIPAVAIDRPEPDITDFTVLIFAGSTMIDGRSG